MNEYMLRNHKKERKEYGVCERYYIIIKQKKEGEVKVDRKEME
jgi:hypothetical protein